MAKSKKKRGRRAKSTNGRSGVGRKEKGSAVAIRSAAALEKYLQGDKPVLIDFWAAWCGPCMAMAPHFEAAAKQWEGRVHFLKVDTERSPALAEEFGIRSLPTLIAMVGDQVVDTKIGATDAASLSRLAQRALDKAEGVGLGGRIKRLFS